MRASTIITFLLINITCAEAFDEMNICFILDGILVLYGIVLTILYCRLRMVSANHRPAAPPEKEPCEGGIYAGLTPHMSDTYETIQVMKKPQV
ncbi:Fc receptor, IgE, high affinity I, gamma polypeptide like isoform X2 [Genypterus blacodes]|uniref:Fc receptor, IgE, high affinity I, gamma polypeptide like isoform X2 n=1 Tax=Genypterus blacodes TaxID=154954 RepID=UPI003F766A98